MQPLRIHCFQHVPFEGLGNIEAWCSENKHSLTYTKFFENAILPELKNIDLLIIMGGPMGVYDEKKYNWLKAEKEFIKQAIDAGKTVIGICLGAQLIANALGAKVYTNQFKEIGWFPIELNSESEKNKLFGDAKSPLTVFHWHGDTFDLPQNSLLLASSGVCKNQAFLYNKKVLGLQFHLEMNEPALKKMLENGKFQLTEETYIQTEGDIWKQRKWIEKNKKLLFRILDNLSL
jgi:GMP synthase-like glutamine amidotransferase